MSNERTVASAAGPEWVVQKIRDAGRYSIFLKLMGFVWLAFGLVSLIIALSYWELPRVQAYDVYYQSWVPLVMHVGTFFAVSAALFGGSSLLDLKRASLRMRVEVDT